MVDIDLRSLLFLNSSVALLFAGHSTHNSPAAYHLFRSMDTLVSLLLPTLPHTCDFAQAGMKYVGRVTPQILQAWSLLGTLRILFPVPGTLFSLV